MTIGIRHDYSYSRYTVQVDGHLVLTTVTASASVVNQWISDIYRIHRLDAEWKPKSDPGKNNPVATLQLCVGHRCLIFQLIHADSIPESLAKFLAEPGFTFVGVRVGEDVEKLKNGCYQLSVERALDLRPLAEKVLGG